MDNIELTIEEMRDWLMNNGWHQLWNDDSWLQKDKHYNNPDYAGISTEQAYKQANK